MEATPETQYNSYSPNPQYSWFDEPEPETKWLIYGLITSDDNVGFNGKPKSGKSTAIRNLTAAVVMGGTFLGREVMLPPRTGRVLYLHIDRKDRKHQVTAELKNLGVTREDSSRVRLLTEQDMPKQATFEGRCDWLVAQAVKFDPHMVVIDLFLQFARTKKGVNDYDNMLDAINTLQDKLNGARYKGVLLISLHARKAVSEDVGDSTLGSTSIRGSLSTGLYFRQYKKQKQYTVESDQTHRAAIGELDETLVNRDFATGTITLGAKLEDLKVAEKKDDWSLRRQRLYAYIQRNPGKTIDEVATETFMATKTVRPILDVMEKDVIYTQGEGVKGDPKLYFVNTVVVGNGKKETTCQTN